MSHNNMIFSVKDCIENSELKNKTTIIVATSQADIKVFMWSLFSFLINGNFNYIDHINININGGNFKTNTNLQDLKQKLIEDLIVNYDVPISLFRIWGRQGHAHSIDSCIPYVHTEYYSLIHDDLILLKDWTVDNEHFLYLKDENRSIIVENPFFMGGEFFGFYEGKPKLNFIHLNSCFVECKKSVLENLGLRWQGYHFKKSFKVDKEFIDFISNFKNLGKKLDLEKIKNAEYEYYSADIGSFVWYYLYENNFNFKTFEDNNFLHIKTASWNSKLAFQSMAFNSDIIKECILKILNSKFANLYLNYSQYSDITF